MSRHIHPACLTVAHTNWAYLSGLTPDKGVVEPACETALNATRQLVFSIEKLTIDLCLRQHERQTVAAFAGARMSSTKMIRRQG